MKQGDKSFERELHAGGPMKLSKDEIAQGNGQLKQARHATIATSSALIKAVILLISKSLVGL